MAKSTISDNRKKKPIGRPKVGAILIGVRVPPADVAVLDAWIKKHAPDLSRPQAIRRLFAIGLSSEKPRVRARRDDGSPTGHVTFEELSEDRRRK